MSDKIAPKTTTSKLNLPVGRHGFTIIEVMIVLAIAALILLVVFLAVPALQRSQRNSARKTDASRVAAAVVDFTSNNTGGLPSTTTHCSSIVTSVGTLSQYTLANPCTIAPTSTTWPASLTSGNLYIATGPIPTSSAPAAVNGVMILAEQDGCNGAGGVTTTGATARNAALLYSIEAGNTYAWACVNPQ